MADVAAAAGPSVVTIQATSSSGSGEGSGVAVAAGREGAGVGVACCDSSPKGSEYWSSPAPWANALEGARAATAATVASTCLNDMSAPV